MKRKFRILIFAFLILTSFASYTPAAILGPHKEMAKLLIAKGADVNARGFFGMTPLNMADDEGEKEMVDLLHKHGAKTAEELKAEVK